MIILIWRGAKLNPLNHVKLFYLHGGAGQFSYCSLDCFQPSCFQFTPMIFHNMTLEVIRRIISCRAQWTPNFQIQALVSAHTGAILTAMGLADPTTILELVNSFACLGTFPQNRHTLWKEVGIDPKIYTDWKASSFYNCSFMFRIHFTLSFSYLPLFDERPQI